ncbi:MAG: nuclear transport factor 2 family protein [Arenicella sp.]
MKISIVITLILLALLSILSVSSCAGPTHSSYVNDYHNAKDKYAASASKFTENGLDANQIKDRFTNVMDNLMAEDLEQRIKQVYASQLYFNDTLHTFSDNVLLTNYLQRTAKRLHDIDVVVEDVVLGDVNAYVRWTMRYKADADSEEIESVGMTHLQFDANGRIVLHQDYWDSYEGFYRTVPGVGFMINQVKKRLE